ncbi:30S ribosomal protein S17 [Staphylococcus aureus]
MSERNDRKVYVGKVVSDKMDKTITVLVETYKTHKLYGKRVKYSKKYKTHDENNSAKFATCLKFKKLVLYQQQKRFRLVVVEEFQ